MRIRPIRSTTIWRFVPLLLSIASGARADDAPTLESLEAACVGGDADACIAAARRRSGGLDVPPDPARARSHYSRAAQLLERRCDRGELLACSGLATLSGHVALAERRRNAAALYRRACDGGLLRACADLGDALWNADSPALYTQSCQGGIGHGCLKLAQVHANWTGWRDADRAAELRRRGLELLEAECAGHQERSCNELLSELEYLPERLRADRLDPRWLEPGCEAGVGRACTALALRTADDPALRIARLERACRLGDAGGCRIAASAYAAGAPGVPKDERRARRFTQAVCYMGWYAECETLCPARDPPACGILAKRAAEHARLAREPIDTVRLFGARYGAPGGASASLALLLGDVDEGSSHTVPVAETVHGPLVGVELGTRAAGLAVGYGWAAGLLKGVPAGIPLAQASLRGSVTRVFDEDATYAGAELGLGYALVNLRIGHLWRVAGPARARDRVVTWGVGLGF